MTPLLYLLFAMQTVKTTDTPWTIPPVTTRAEWESRSAAMRKTILFRTGLWPMPERTPLNAKVFGRMARNGYTVEKAYFESVPGFFVTGNLYRPGTGSGPWPAVLAPHGHGAYGRLIADDTFNEPMRAASMARQGYVVFTYDMVGMNDSFQVPHDYASQEAQLWGFSVMGLQLWNSIRALDFLQSLPDVDGTKIASAGASGGGTQTFLLAAVDDRVKVAVPANMVSHYMQGGDNCENTPGLRLDHSNVEFAAMTAPRPMLLVAATGDWTRDTARIEFPAIRDVYKLFGAEASVSYVEFQAGHNFSRPGREASYAWIAKWLKGTPDTPKEAGTSIESPGNLLVWEGRERPKGLDTAGVLDYWRKLPVDTSAMLLAVAPPDVESSTLVVRPHLPGGKTKTTVAVLLAGVEDAALIAELNRAGRAVYFVEPFVETRDLKSRNFATYNRTADQIRVADILAAAAPLEKQYGTIDLIGGLPALVAREIHPSFRRTVIDVARFPNGDEAAYTDRLFIPGILRAGGFQGLSKDGVVVHNTGGLFHAPCELKETQLSPSEISAIVTGSGKQIQ